MDKREHCLCKILENLLCTVKDVSEPSSVMAGAQIVKKERPAFNQGLPKHVETISMV